MRNKLDTILDKYRDIPTLPHDTRKGEWGHQIKNIELYFNEHCEVMPIGVIHAEADETTVLRSIGRKV